MKKKILCQVCDKYSSCVKTCQEVEKYLKQSTKYQEHLLLRHPNGVRYVSDKIVGKRYTNNGGKRKQPYFLEE